MAAALKRLNFEVETLLDPNRLALEGAAGRYGDRSVSADVSLFYFSGHALESASRNWLLPASASLATERDLRFEAVDLNTVQEQADGAARISIIFLDACRDNPFSRFLFLAAPVVAAASSSQSLVTLDSMFWDSIKASHNPADFKAYLMRAPSTRFIGSTNSIYKIIKQNDWRISFRAQRGA